jgi:hypothetical protein
MDISLKRTLLISLTGAAIAGVLAIAFLAYLRPAFVLDLANRFMLCF